MSFDFYELSFATENEFERARAVIEFAAETGRGKGLVRNFDNLEDIETELHEYGLTASIARSAVSDDQISPDQPSYGLLGLSI